MAMLNNQMVYMYIYIYVYVFDIHKSKGQNLVLSFKPRWV